jgi:hypothetical protein
MCLINRFDSFKTDDPGNGTNYSKYMGPFMNCFIYLRAKNIYNYLLHFSLLRIEYYLALNVEFKC